MPEPYYFDYCSFEFYFKIGKCESSNFAAFKIALAISSEISDEL
jgi:hypothetical protein